MFYVEYAQTIIFRSPIPGATSQEEAEQLYAEDLVDYDNEEIIGSYDNYEMLEINEEKDL